MHVDGHTPWLVQGQRQLGGSQRWSQVFRLGIRLKKNQPGFVCFNFSHNCFILCKTTETLHNNSLGKNICLKYIFVFEQKINKILYNYFKLHYEGECLRFLSEVLLLGTVNPDRWITSLLCLSSCILDVGLLLSVCLASVPLTSTYSSAWTNEGKQDAAKI